MGHETQGRHEHDQTCADESQERITQIDQVEGGTGQGGNYGDGAGRGDDVMFKAIEHRN
jgi:hypothetical protein